MIIYRMPQALLATKIFFRRLHRNMPEQELDLLQFAA
jgi:hypothetical protein